MTAQEVIPLADEGTDALERGDVEAYMSLVEATMHPNIEFSSAVLGEVEGATYRGHDGIRRWATDLLDTADVAYRERQYRALNEGTLLALSRFEMKGKGSGAHVIRELGTVAVFEEGLVVRLTAYLSHAEAIAAAEKLVGAGA